MVHPLTDTVLVEHLTYVLVNIEVNFAEPSKIVPSDTLHRCY